MKSKPWSDEKRFKKVALLFLTTNKRYHIMGTVFVLRPIERLLVIYFMPFTQGLWIVFVSHEKQFTGCVPGSSHGEANDECISYRPLFKTFYVTLKTHSNMRWWKLSLSSSHTLLCSPSEWVSERASVITESERTTNSTDFYGGPFWSKLNKIFSLFIELFVLAVYFILLYIYIVTFCRAFFTLPFGTLSE